MSGMRRRKGWPHGGERFTFECAACGKQTSVTAGTIMHGSKLPLLRWFWAVSTVATPFQWDFGAANSEKQLGLGSSSPAWLLCAELRHAMVARATPPLAGLVEVDQTEIPLRTKADSGFAAAAAARPRAKCWSPAPRRSRKRTRPERLRLAADPRTSPAPSLHWLRCAPNIAPRRRRDQNRRAGRPYARAPTSGTSPMPSAAISQPISFCPEGPPRPLRRRDPGRLRASITDCESKHTSKATSTNSCSASNRRRDPTHSRLPLPLLAIGLVPRPLTYNMLIMPEAQG